MLKRILPICLILFLSCDDDPVSPYDECGVLNGDNSSCTDCAGVPNGDALQDECGVCDNNPNNDCMQDACGVWGGR